MREIKFRAWHKQLKKMFSAEEMAADQLTMLPTGKFINVHTIPALSQINYDMIPLQFTAMKDKNGVEIFEGDVIEYVPNVFDKDPPLRRFLVEWGRWCFVKRAHDNVNSLDSIEARSQFIVVGNIFEHPSLLTPSPVTEEK
jgi:uncharacterized phage protein (TIGR01671 family)